MILTRYGEEAAASRDEEDKNEDVVEEAPGPSSVSDAAAPVPAPSAEDGGVIFVLEKASLEAAKVGKNYQLLNCEDHATFLKKHKRDLALYRPDILHQALLAILDSTLNKASIRANNGPDKLMRILKQPMTHYLPLEIKEAMELPLTHPELYEDIGIKPPKGVILYGEPGTGKTLLAKVVANSTLATFLRVVGSELIQKYLGDGPSWCENSFVLLMSFPHPLSLSTKLMPLGQREWVSEVPALLGRYDAHSGGEREIQRTMLELLNQLDGFDARADVKVIFTTNRIESLDPALLRPLGLACV
ncbi:unnamed protein product [Sphagnum jensenii]|uniref:ATPase AAA-type core domain-containing protein n=1 Tax=Sphagnum jensenii TaxID=128206 RepID=A0ABP0WCY4_9BRYO